jgi:hypothetical protein
MYFRQLFTSISTWFWNTVDHIRQSQQPTEPSSIELAVIAEILEKASEHNVQVETVARALAYMQLYPQLSLADAMILGSSTWSELESDQDEL